MNGRRPSLLALVAVLAVAVTGCGGGDGGGDKGGGAAPPKLKAGTGTITVLSLWGGSERKAFQKVLADFEKRTGIKTKYETARDFLPVVRSRLAAGNPPMVAIVPRPGIVADLAREESLKSFAELGIEDTVKNNYGAVWQDLATVDEELYGIVVKANSKSTVWYRPKSYDELGVEPPKTWDDLLAVTNEYKQAGKTPWSVGAKGVDSWTLTDWFENIYVRQAGPEKYSQLFGGKLPFTDQSVKDALTAMTQIINDENVAGGVEGALGTDFVSGIGQVFGTRPKAEMYMAGGFVGGIALGEINPDLKPGTDIAFFPFPTIGDAKQNPLVGGGDLAVAFEANQDVKRLMNYLATKEAGELWAGTGAIVSPNRTVDLAVYPNELARAEAEQVRGAQVFRFDGSDLLPGALGEDWGRTLQGVIRKPAEMGQLLDDFQQDASAEFES